MNIAILGAGAWGSALAVSLAPAHRVKLWTRARVDADLLSRTRASHYLPGICIPAAVSIESDLGAAVERADLVLVATSTAGLRETATRVHAIDRAPTLGWACKGFEAATALLPHQVVAEALPEARRVGALSGPSFALEVAKGLPTAIVFASADSAFAHATASALNSARLRIYSSGDLAGVELGGALKNVVAIAAGISDGLALGRNARAALVTRGLAEISRLGVAMGGQAETFNGLTGLGDLVLTCTGELSRNREVGVRLARGIALDAILAELGHVAEGVHSARAARDHARGHGVEMPITEAVCAVLFEGRPAMDAVQQLLMRDPRRE
ncbi:MAG: NAD(P)-dependent glycerol-3-phosphate dehydrogenase [Burkholderiales bacterium]|nr:NAD(P)-dependent glycerol-3-phosphate dehydrogenase [Burkholderiales bacterium]